MYRMQIQQVRTVQFVQSINLLLQIIYQNHVLHLTIHLFQTLCFLNQLSLYTLVYCCFMKPQFSIYSIYFEEGLKTLNFTRRKFEQVLQLCRHWINTISRFHFQSRENGQCGVLPLRENRGRQNSSEQSCHCLLFRSISVPKIRSTPNSKWSNLQ